MQLSPDRRATFLAELARHGIVARAARAASPHSTNGCVMSFRDLRESDADFALAWDEALEHAKGNVESELHRRAVEGWDEPIYGGKNREQVVGTVRRYSDRLLELRAKALLPEYRERSRLELGGGLDVQGPKQVDFRPVFEKLSREQRAEMRELLLRAGAVLEGKTLPHLASPLSAPEPEHESPAIAADAAVGAAVTQTEGGAQCP